MWLSVIRKWVLSVWIITINKLPTSGLANQLSEREEQSSSKTSKTGSSPCRSALLTKISPRIKLSILLFYQTFHCINHSQSVPIKIKINFVLRAKWNLIGLENVSVTIHEQPTPLGKSWWLHSWRIKRAAPKKHRSKLWLPVSLSRQEE